MIDVLINDILLDDVLRESSLDCGLDDIVVPVLSADVVPFDTSRTFSLGRRKAWSHGIEPRCDFLSHSHVSKQAGLIILSRWRTSPKGRTLSEIKSDDAEVAHFDAEVSAMLLKAFKAFDKSQWAIVTTPKRRHLQRNFATLTAAAIAESLGIEFYEDAAIARSRGRINAVFSLQIVPRQPNIIVFDDIVTSGSTLKAMCEVLQPYGKTLVFTVGIDNS